MALAYSDMVDVGNVPPVVSNDRHALPFILEACSVLRKRHGVSVVYDRRGEASRGFVRGNQTLFGAFDPPRSWASDIFGVMALKDDEVIGVLQMDTSKYRLILVFGGWGRLARALAVPSVH
jgi:hypothetical protein